MPLPGNERGQLLVAEEYFASENDAFLESLRQASQPKSLAGFAPLDKGSAPLDRSDCKMGTPRYVNVWIPVGRRKSSANGLGALIFNS